MITKLYELSLTQLFGDGATQTLTTVTIQKSSLLRLTPLPNNTGESLLAAILITALANFEGTITDENNQPLTTENNVNITFDNSDQFELLNMFTWKPFPLVSSSRKVKINQIIIESFELSGNEYD